MTQPASTGWSHHAGRETVRSWMVEGKQWRASEQAWLEERGPKLSPIGMIDDASSRIHAWFVRHDSREENMRRVWSYLERHGGRFAIAPNASSSVTSDGPRDAGVSSHKLFKFSAIH